MKTLILLTAMALFACNPLALEANDPQDPTYRTLQEVDIVGYWENTYDQHYRISVDSFTNVNNPYNPKMKGYLTVKYDTNTYVYSYYSDTLSIHLNDRNTLKYVRYEW